MNIMRYKIQIIGSYLEQISKVLDSMDIFTENIINNCSPLAMTGTFDPAYQKYSDMPELKPHELISIRKNLDKVLSHDPKKFSDNYNVLPMTKNVRSQNTSEYLVYMNSSIELSVIEKSDMVYSEYTTDEIRNAIKSSAGGYIRRTFPFEGSFNWKYYYDRFINIILNEYDPEHIIFIRSNVSRFYMDEQNIKSYDKLSEKFVGMIEEMDNYFIQKTHCLVIDEHLNNIPPKYVDCLFPYIQTGSRIAASIADKIGDIIVNKNIDAYKTCVKEYSNDLLNILVTRLSKDIISQNKKHLQYIDENMLTIDKIEQKISCKFFDDITKLKRFLDAGSRYRLSEYAVDVCINKTVSADIELIELYVRYFKLDLNDIIAVYLLYNECKNTAAFKKITKIILDSSNCISVNTAKKFKEKNIEFLKKYPYISVKKFSDNSSAVYILLENNCYIVLDPYCDPSLRKFVFNACKNLDHKQIISNGYTCSIEDADALTYSYDYYIEKARNGDGAKPTFLKFDNENELFISLCYINYIELLKNEKFIFQIGNKSPENIYDFTPIVDLTELLDPKTVTVNIEAGLGDQLCNYVMGKIIEKYAHKKIIYDTTKCKAFNGFEVDRFAKEPMCLLTSKLSPRLIPMNGSQVFKKIYLKLSNDYTYMTQIFNYPRYEINAKGAPCYMCGENKKDFIEFNLPHMYFNTLLRIEKLMQYYDFKLKDFIEFPTFEDERLTKLSDEMMSCDAVVMHVRRGDYVTFGCAVDNEYYKSALQSIIQINDYPNKKFFIFSDDIQWCRSHLDEL